MDRRRRRPRGEEVRPARRPRRYPALWRVGPIADCFLQLSARSVGLTSLVHKPFNGGPCPIGYFLLFLGRLAIDLRRETALVLLFTPNPLLKFGSV